MKRLRNTGLLLAALFAITGGSGQAHAALVSVSLQEGINAYAGTQDTYILGDSRGAAPTTPNGTGTTLGLWERDRSFTNAARVLIRYDLSGITPATLAVTNASLTLTMQAYAFGTFNTPTSLYLVSAADAVWTEAQATYINADQSSTTPWAGGPGLVAGPDYNATPIATVNTPASAWADGTQLTFTFNAAGLAAINDWLANPSNNHGFFITQPWAAPAPGTDNFNLLYSSEAANAAFHPLLQLDGVIPEPSTIALLGAGGLLLWRRWRGGVME